MQHAIRSVSPSCPAEFMQDVPVGGDEADAEAQTNHLLKPWLLPSSYHTVQISLLMISNCILVLNGIQILIFWYISDFLLSYHPYQRHSLYWKHQKPPSSLSECGSKWFLQREQAWVHTQGLGKPRHWEWTSYNPIPKPGCSPLPWILAALGRLKNCSLFAYLFRDTVFEMESLWRALSILKDH